jgi:precorrin-6B methylase 2
MQTNQHTPERILQVGLGFWASKTLLAAIRFGLFTLLAKGPLRAEAIREQLHLHPRSVYDFLDALTALGYLRREGLLQTAVYSNSDDTAIFLDRNKPSYIGGLLEMVNNRLYTFWGSLEEGLQTGLPQNEIKSGNADLFDHLYRDPQRLAEFVQAMGNFQMGNFMAFASVFDFSKYQTLVDAGGAGGLLCAQVALQHPHMQCITYDLPPVEPIAQANIDRFGVADKVKCMSGDFFKDNLPGADIVVMGNILHDWNEEQKLGLFKKAYEALPAGGAFVAIENVIDNDRNQNVFGLLMSLNMLIETPGGFDYTQADFDRWAKQTGFGRTVIIPLAGPTSAAIAYK